MPKTQDILTRGFNYQNVKVLKESEIVIREGNYFGQSVWMPMTLRLDKGSWSDGKKNHIVFKVYIPCCIVEVNGTKTIIKTAIQGLNTGGTVKEYINHGDLNISIKGMFASKSNRYPQEEVNGLMELIKAPVALVVEHTLLNSHFGVSSLVIESYNFPSKQGMQNVQLFELNCVSDVPYELVRENAVKNQSQANKNAVSAVSEAKGLTEDQKSSVSKTIEKLIGNVGKVSADVRAKMDTVGVDFETLTNPNVPLSQKLGQMKKLLGDKSIITDILNTTDGGQIIDNLILTQNQYDEMMRARTQFELFLNQYV